MLPERWSQSQSTPVVLSKTYTNKHSKANGVYEYLIH